MDAYTMVHVNLNLEHPSIDPKRYRTAPLVVRPNLRDRVASAAAGLGRMLGPDSGPTIPQLKNYPYGG